MREVFIRDAHYQALRTSTFGVVRDSADKICRWLVFKIVDIIRYRAVQHPSVIATGIITNVFIIISVLSAFPWIRK